MYVQFTTGEVARFWSKVDKSAGEDGCWLWTAKLVKGYGGWTIRRSGKSVRLYAHRTAWMFANGPIPDGIHVCHTCDNPRCVNLAHLFLGTQAENVADMMAKGRHRTAPPKTPRRDETFLRGERHPHARLTWEKVCAIRQLHQDGAMGTAELATHFGVTQTHIQYIVTGKSWRVRA